MSCDFIGPPAAVLLVQANLHKPTEDSECLKMIESCIFDSYIYFSPSRVSNQSWLLDSTTTINQTTQYHTMQQLLRQMSSSREKSADLEAHSLSITDRTCYDKRLEFVQLLFNVDAAALSAFPGIEAYHDYLESTAFQPLMSSSYASLWDLMSRTEPRGLADCWHWLVAVLRVIRLEQPEVSVHDILRRLTEQGGKSHLLKRDLDKSFLYAAVFGVLCWSSFVVRPRLSFTSDIPPNLTCLPPEGFKTKNSANTHRLSDRCMRPFLTALRSLKQQHWGDQPTTRIEESTRETGSLFEASLNMYSLRYFGHVSIQWVDTMSEHLRFNPANRRLSLFRFPTFCALFTIHGDNVCPAIRSIAEQLDPLSPDDRDECCVSLEQEILLSYRLLFGQDNKSRKVARGEFSRLSSSGDKQHIDDMLVHLCGRKYESGVLS